MSSSIVAVSQVIDLALAAMTQIAQYNAIVANATVEGRSELNAAERAQLRKMARDSVQALIDGPAPRPPVNFGDQGIVTPAQVDTGGTGKPA